MAAGSGRGVGEILRRRRQEMGLTLARLADTCGCAKSYLSAIENERTGPPGEDILWKLEQALMLDRGVLIEAASWARTPPTVRRELERMKIDRTMGRRLAELLSTGLDAQGQVRASLDDAYRSGELGRLVGRLTDGEQDVQRVSMTGQVPLINKVAAGYPQEFTDLGYPARVADEYVSVVDLADPDAFAARVVGDSMEPEYRQGDVVVFSPMLDVRDGMDCFARLEHNAQTTFKRVYFETGEDGKELIRLQPLNSAYPPRVLGREEVAGLYVAVSVTRSVGCG